MNVLKITACTGHGASVSIEDGTIELVMPFSPTDFAFGTVSLVGEEEISTYGLKLDGNGKLRLVQTAKRRHT